MHDDSLEALHWWPMPSDTTTSPEAASVAPTAPRHTSALPWRSGTVDVDGVGIAFDEVGAGEPIVLIMGLAIQSIFWPDEFCADLVARGFRVVRFDNRDIGLSASVDRGVPVNIPRDFLLARLGRKPRANYTLHHMVADTFGVMDHLDLPRAHVVGISLGGIIGQMMAVARPERVRSLSLIMSHTNHALWGMPHPSVLLSMGPPPAGATREQIIERNVRSFQTLASPAYRRSDDELRYAFSVAWDRDSRTAGLDRQTHALFATGCIDDTLQHIKAPTTVMHGLADKLVLPHNARRIAARIAGSRLTLFPGMGHDFPPALLPTWARLIAENADRAV